MASRATWPLGVAILTGVAAAFAPSGCLKTHETEKTDPAVAECTSCHGDANRSGDALSRSAPPFDLLHQTDPSYAGVGAHQIHLNASSTHGAIACNECHVVPDAVDSPGHADSDRPAEVTFGELAKKGDRAPEYEAKPQTCVDSYCHQSAQPVWSLPRSSAEACGSCHGLPPPSPHPQSDRCDACHGEVIDSERHFLAPERHVDGNVDLSGGECNLCHGGPNNDAPPVDTSGNTDITAIGVGAHQAHLSGGDVGRPLRCNECHVVPENVGDPTHADGLPAEVVLTGVATSRDSDASYDHESATCTAFCHSPTPGNVHASPVWNAPTTLTCTTCHDTPPPPPHPQMSQCSTCHGDVVDTDDRTIIEKSLHVNGAVDVSFDESCNACHGGDNAAPPRDVDGHTRTTFAGVGAHQTHVLGTERSRAVPCDTCHVVPRGVFDEGHMDTARPAEVVFSDVATVGEADPSYAGGTCASTYCHGAVFPDERTSGGSNTEPTWTRVDGSEAACGSCHGLPPPPPHPLDTYPCHQCHSDIDTDDRTFIHPEEHVDGIVTLAFP